MVFRGSTGVEEFTEFASVLNVCVVMNAVHLEASVDSPQNCQTFSVCKYFSFHKRPHFS